VGITIPTPKEAPMYRRKQRILKSLVLGLAVAALAAPSAFGEPRGPGNPMTDEVTPQAMSPDDRSYYRGGSGEQPSVSPDDRALPRGTDGPLSIPVSSLSPDDRALPRSVDGPYAPVPVSLSPDDRALPRGVDGPTGPVSTPVSSFSPDDRALPRGTESPIIPVSVTLSQSDDFQWADAGLGAVSTLAFIMLLGIAMFLVRNQRRRIVAY
jgi:hypothetical protein